MKKRLLVALILVLYTAAFILPAPVQAGDIFRFSGTSAVAYFFTEDDTGCLITYAGVFANKGKSQSPPGPGSKSGIAEIFVDQYDICTDSAIRSAYGWIFLDSGAFQIDRLLTSASLNATIPVYDYVNETSLSLGINMTWTGIGVINQGTFHYHFKSPGCVNNYRYTGSYRFAQASGTVSDGVINFTPSLSGYAELSSSRSGILSIGCN